MKQHYIKQETCSTIKTPVEKEQSNIQELKLLNLQSSTCVSNYVSILCN